MHLVPVQSSRIKALGYDEATWTCFVQFQPTAREPKGTVYAYTNVAPELFTKFLSAPSIGRFFGQHLADRAAHPSLRLGEPHALRQQASSEGRDRRPRGASGTASSTSRRDPRADEELEQLELERQRLVEFFRPMREATLAAHQAVIAQEEEALAQFQAAEALVVSRLAQAPEREMATAGRSGSGR